MVCSISYYYKNAESIIFVCSINIMKEFNGRYILCLFTYRLYMENTSHNTVKRINYEEE